MIAWVGWVAVFISLLGAAFAVASARWASGYLVRSAVDRTQARVAPAVTVMKPLHGAETALRENLESFCRQDYPGTVQLLFGVHGVDDPAVATVRDLQRNHPDLDIQLVIDGRVHGENRKVSNLLNMTPAIAHDIVVMSDSDIHAPSDYLTQVVERLNRPEVGFVTCLYTGSDVGSAWSRLAAMGIDYQFLPNVAAGLRLKMAQPCFGATIALRRRVLEEVGGFAALNNQLADDYDLGRAVRRAGYRGEVAAVAVQHLCAERSLGELWRHETRWARTIRMIDPLGFLGQGLTYTTAWGALGCLLTAFHPLAAAALLASLAGRVYLVHRVDGATGQAVKTLALLPLRDVLSFAVFLSASSDKTVVWRGRRFRIGADGALVSVEESPANAPHPVLAGAFLRRFRRRRGVALPGQARNQILLVSDVARPAGGLGRDQQADRRPAA